MNISMKFKFYKYMKRLTANDGVIQKVNGKQKIQKAQNNTEK